MVDEFIRGRDDLWLAVEKRSADAGTELVFRLKGRGNYFLHWGLARQCAGAWQSPPPPLWPAS